ncbi:MAG: hypothetical protein ABIA47_03990 [bacterium]
MKNLLLASLSIILIGAGCLGIGGDEPEVVEGDWLLAFDLPEDWVMVAPYDMDRPINYSKEIDQGYSEVILQSTGFNIYTDEAVPSDEELIENGIDLKKIVTEDYIQISASHIDKRRLIPEDAEELGSGFYKVEVCDNVSECELANRYRYDYYFETESAKYKFIVYTNGRDVSEVEDVIFSAQEVTPYQ